MIKKIESLRLAAYPEKPHNDTARTMRRKSSPQRRYKKRLRFVKKTPPQSYLYHPLDKERAFLAALRRRDMNIAKRILDGFLASFRRSGPGTLSLTRYRAVELIVLLSRTALGTNKDHFMPEENNRYIRRIQKARNNEELTALLNRFAKKRGAHIFSLPNPRRGSRDNPHN
ncbi:MAG: hypothetical protein LBP60_00785 [Spirochaetaceae bacterium]|nr:hypothetical protein [Spirochaetaceae bacterium]